MIYSTWNVQFASGILSPDSNYDNWIVMARCLYRGRKAGCMQLSLSPALQLSWNPVS